MGGEAVLAAAHGMADVKVDSDKAMKRNSRRYRLPSANYASRGAEQCVFKGCLQRAVSKRHPYSMHTPTVSTLRS
jgi:hypothetical protein